jgi:hypothetical protein
VIKMPLAYGKKEKSNRPRALYKGRLIIKMPEGYWCGGKIFKSLAAATKAIDAGDI